MTPAPALSAAGRRIVLACSGGLETSIAIPWLADRHGAEIIAVTVDLGQGKDVLEEIRDRALATGALRAHVVDARDAFARDYIVRALKAGILGELSPVAAALAHPLIAQKLVEIANIEQATIAAPYLGLLRDGRWFTPERETLDRDADAVQQQVSGVVRLTLFEGACGVNGVQVRVHSKTIALAKAND
jgi:argininosuccinate synthase